MQFMKIALLMFSAILFFLVLNTLGLRISGARFDAIMWKKSDPLKAQKLATCLLILLASLCIMFFVANCCKFLLMPESGLFSIALESHQEEEEQ